MRDFIDDGDLQAALAKLFTKSAFRLELLDAYVAANEAEPFGRFLAGKPADLAWRRPWQSFVHRSLAAGRTMQRVHVVDEPLNDYLRFELTAVYPASVEAGEDIRIMLRGAPPHSARDFWLLDDRWVLTLIYQPGGVLTGADITDERPEIRRAQQWRDQALQHAIPLDQYMARGERRTA